MLAKMPEKSFAAPFGSGHGHAQGLTASDDRTGCFIGAWIGFRLGQCIARQRLQTRFMSRWS
jgi:hypothetical protein